MYNIGKKWNKCKPKIFYVYVQEEKFKNMQYRKSVAKGQSRKVGQKLAFVEYDAVLLADRFREDVVVLVANEPSFEDLLHNWVFFRCHKLVHHVFHQIEIDRFPCREIQTKA